MPARPDSSVTGRERSFANWTGAKARNWPWKGGRIAGIGPACPVPAGAPHMKEKP